MITTASLHTRLAVVLALVGGFSFWVRHSQTVLQRPDSRALGFVEDTRDASGTRVTVLTRSRDTAGSEAVVRLLIRPGAPGFFHGFAGSTPMHVHPEQTEAVQVVSGLLGYNLNGSIAKLRAGETLLVPQGTPHSIWSAGSEPLELLLTQSPAGRLGEAFFEQLAGLGATYGDVTQIHPLQLVLLCETAGFEFVAPRVFTWALRRVVAPFAYLMGFRATHAQYCSDARLVG